MFSFLFLFFFGKMSRCSILRHLIPINHWERCTLYMNSVGNGRQNVFFYDRQFFIVKDEFGRKIVKTSIHWIISTRILFCEGFTLWNISIKTPINSVPTLSVCILFLVNVWPFIISYYLWQNRPSTGCKLVKGLQLASFPLGIMSHCRDRVTYISLYI